MKEVQKGTQGFFFLPLCTSALYYSRNPDVSASWGKDLESVTCSAELGVWRWPGKAVVGGTGGQHNLLNSSISKKEYRLSERNIKGGFLLCLRSFSAMCWVSPTKKCFRNGTDHCSEGRKCYSRQSLCWLGLLILTQLATEIGTNSPFATGDITQMSKKWIYTHLSFQEQAF